MGLYIFIQSDPWFYSSPAMGRYEAITTYVKLRLLFYMCITSFLTMLNFVCSFYWPVSQSWKILLQFLRVSPCLYWLELLATIITSLSSHFLGYWYMQQTAPGPRWVTSLRCKHQPFTLMLCFLSFNQLLSFNDLLPGVVTALLS